MALFPSNPTNGQQATVNGTLYTYDSAQTAWVRTSSSPVGDLTVTGNISATGNVAATFFIGNGSQLTGLSTDRISNGNSNVNIPAANGNVNITAVGNTTLVITGTGANITGTLNATGNANTGNLGTGRVIATGNISGTQLISNIATGTAPLVVSSNTVVSNLNADLLDGFNTSQTATANTVAVRDANGNVSANFFIGNGSQLTGIITSVSNVSNGNSNLNIATANGNVTVSVSGNANIVTVTGTGVNIAGTLNATGNANVGNLGTAGLITATGNVSGGNLTTTGSLSVTGTGNIGGNLTAANLTVGTGTGGNITGANLVSANFFTGTLTTASQPNITTVGTLTNLAVSGNAVISGNLTVDGNLTYVNVDTLAVEDPIINLQTGPNGAAPTSNSGKDVGTALNYFDTAARIAFMGWDVSNAEFGLASVATLTNEVVTFTTYGNLRVGNIIGNGQALTGLAGANVTGTVGSATNAAALLQNTSAATTVYPTFTTSSANGNSSAVINTGISANLGNASITATITGNANGQITLSMTAANTSSLTPGRYVYDLIIRNSVDNSVTRVVEGTAVVLPSVTR